MPKSYTTCPAPLHDRLARLISTHHPRLDGVRVELLFVAHDKDGPALKLAGYACFAVVRALPLKQRVAGRGDAEIVIDEARYHQLTPSQQDALLDHELTHLEPAGKLDTAGRPQLTLRLHDRQYGWFDEVAQRHGAAAIEVAQATAFYHAAAQTYFAFTATPKVA